MASKSEPQGGRGQSSPRTGCKHPTDAWQAEPQAAGPQPAGSPHCHDSKAGTVFWGGCPAGLSRTHRVCRLPGCWANTPTSNDP